MNNSSARLFEHSAAILWSDMTRRQTTRSIAVVVVAIAAGAAIGAEDVAPILSAGTLALGFVVGLLSWRLSVLGLVLVLPFLGVAAVITYPQTGAAALLKDLYLVLPAYVGFAVGLITKRNGRDQRATFSVPTVPWRLVVAFAVLVTAQAFNPMAPNPLAVVIGIKVWLFYVPFLFLGYSLVHDMRSLVRSLTVVTCVGLLPALIGIAEAALIYTGRADLAYMPYGDAAAVATQAFTQFDLTDGGFLRRVPSTFSSVTQYYLFMVSMVAVSYAWWRVREPSRIGAAVWAVMVAATFLTGARGAFVMVPLLIVLIAMLDSRRPRATHPIAVAVLLLLGASALFSTSVGNLLAHAVQTGVEDFTGSFVGGVGQALATTLVGLGTGADTNATRYAYADPGSFQGIDGTWYESWYVKVLLELGIAGIGVVIALFGTLLWRSLRAHRALRDSRLRSVSASLLALLVWLLVNNVKGQYLDFDPTNIYFWLFAGVVARLPELEKSARLG